MLPSAFFLLDLADEQVDKLTWSFYVAQWSFELGHVFFQGMSPSLYLFFCQFYPILRVLYPCPLRDVTLYLEQLCARSWFLLFTILLVVVSGFVLHYHLLNGMTKVILEAAMTHFSLVIWGLFLAMY